ncbi:hypothetical protein N657DRAFT_691674 [Parathielavia appendiculata]|uniref:Protection of telomeres protein 1 n=1 Tax=Parathielavia appendiculata TaxID=2587402 RepID=A0AAN6TX95_9PEZI|nr:hypothetical protein N657DRAFT_691674 [Parathielavia appendiculata]
MPVGASRATAAGTGPPEPSLPPNYTELRVIHDEEVSPGSFVNVIGVVQDCRLPIPTSGKDYKSTLTLYDLSIQDEGYGINLVIFRPEADMRQVTAGDVVAINTAKVQRFQGTLSLITNHKTAIRVYTASKIPEPPESARTALAPGPKRDSRPPSVEEEAYVSHIYHKIDKYSLPDEHEFQAKAVQSLNLKRKFSLLEDVKEGHFYDLVAHVARDPHYGDYTLGLATLYISDYTENPNFHPQVWQDSTELAPVGGDPYGYNSGSVDMPTKDWVGPYGKRTIQLTCFEPHATYVRDEVRAGQWVALRNVHIKYGRDGRFLEGFMHGEQNISNSRINVQILEKGDIEENPNFKEAIRRFRDYDKKRKKEIKEIKAAQAAGLKRKAAVSSEQGKSYLNSKERRKRKREEIQKKEKENLANQELCLGLSDNITCEAHNAPYSTIASMLNPLVHQATINNQTAAIVMPFTCAKYRAQVRVVDFFPPSLEDFACSRKSTLLDALSDNEDGSECRSSSEDEDSPGGTDRVWEWRFALQLEDPAPPPPADTDRNKNNNTTTPRPRVWVFVDNAEAQCLTSLDAADLRRNPELLVQLRERMFKLWGNLEEHKARAAGQQQKQAAKQGGARPGGKKPNPLLNMPPLNQSSPAEAEGGGRDAVKEEPISNKPFACCIKQYGIYEKEEPGKAGRWVRCFGLFGTKINI